MYYLAKKITKSAQKMAIYESEMLVKGPTHAVVTFELRQTIVVGIQEDNCL